MGLSAWNAYRAKQAELEKTLTQPQPQNEDISTSPVVDGVEVEKPKEVIEVVEEVKPKKKKGKK